MLLNFWILSEGIKKGMKLLNITNTLPQFSLAALGFFLLCSLNHCLPMYIPILHKNSCSFLIIDVINFCLENGTNKSMNVVFIVTNY